MEYDLKRSKRKTVSIGFDEECRVVVKVPLRLSVTEIERIVNRHESWIIRERQKRREELTERQRCFDGTILIGGERVAFFGDVMAEYGRLAAERLPAVVDSMRALTGGEVKKLRYTNAKSYWGRCTSSGEISLHVLLTALPLPLCEYVVVHELTHLKHMNHSKRFWESVEQVLPDYRDRRRRLKQYHWLTRLSEPSGS